MLTPICCAILTTGGSTVPDVLLLAEGTAALYEREKNINWSKVTWHVEMAEAPDPQK